ncbi:aminopeptidase N [Actinomyces radicidentis]|uniref:aminopeptidase N n=1 Tax=Actinomyces radicidentis TaxID=111015 RepID=UPI0028E64AE7|nr:aminopeptidase N [Actinomyces radicidentis]
MTAPTTAPARPTSPTNLGREEAAWRSETIDLQSLTVTLDLTSAPVPAHSRPATGFYVRSELALTVRGDRPAVGLWVDFLGEEVRELTIDGESVEVSWDGARVSLPELAAGQHAVAVDAVGRFSNSGQGLHRFHDPVDGRTYLYTHFEPSDARRAWPCADQPDLKAPFLLTVVHPEPWTVLSNGLVETTECSDELDGAAVTRFTPTLPLPSYLTAVSAGEWHRVSTEWRSALRPGDAPIPVSWSCRRSLAEHLDGDVLLETTLKGLDLYDEAYAFPFPWGSYDSVLVPEYNLGAMENPGCVTFNEDAYLYQGPVTRAQRAGRANTILHEMCHMWFGDLVTPTWWEDTWLKESFAENQGTWAEATATEHTEAWVSFASSRKAWAYLEDSRPATTHPIVATVDDVEAARQAFDGITYAKGAAVLKQLVAHLGQETFLAAARDWFRGHAFANGDLAEFLGTLSQASGRDMDAWADAWLRTAGPSVLTDELETDGRSIQRLTVAQSGTDLATGEPVLRPHTLVVGLYSFDGDGVLTRTHRLPVTLEAASAEVPEAVGLPAPDLVTLNDEDLTYAVIRPDAASLATARQALSRLADPMARALWWSTLFNLVRDGLLSPAVFIETVLSQGDDTTDPATLTTLLGQAQLCALGYAHPEDRAGRLVALLGVDADAPGENGWTRLQAAEAGSDAQLVRARAWLAAAGQAGLLGFEQRALVVSRVRSVLDGALTGLDLDADLRWRALISLARLGELREGELAEQLALDPSASGRIHFLQAASSEPKASTKEKLLTRLLTEDELSNDQVDAVIGGYAVAAHRGLTAPLTDRYLGSLEELWAGRGQEIATRIVLGLFPAVGDETDLTAVDAWLEGHGGAAAALRRLVLKGRDDLARALRARG